MAEVRMATVELTAEQLRDALGLPPSVNVVRCRAYEIDGKTQVVLRVTGEGVPPVGEGQWVPKTSLEALRKAKAPATSTKAPNEAR